MKYLLLGLFFFSLYSCTKKDTDTVPLVPTPTGKVSKFNITFNGKTYKETIDDLHPIAVDSVFVGKNPKTGVKEYQFQIYWETRNLMIMVSGSKTDTTSATGSYYTNLSGSSLPKPVSSENTITVFGDTTRSYIGDDKSTVTITSHNDAEWKGTLNFTLHNNGISYPATGDFEFYK